jgi:hypothetical protein
MRPRPARTCTRTETPSLGVKVFFSDTFEGCFDIEVMKPRD